VEPSSWHKVGHTVKGPHKTEEVNYTWQVGRSVVNEEIIQYDLNPENLKAKWTLKLIRGKVSFDPSIGRKKFCF